MRAAPQMPNTEYRHRIFQGGMDQVSPGLTKKPGYARDAKNFECNVNGGYSRIKGYERFSGQPSPSDATYAIVNATITGSPAVGDTLTGASSGATGVIIALPSGNTSFVITKVTGTFTNGENLNVGGPTIAVATSTQMPGGASTAVLDVAYRNLAADEYRDDIAAVTGSGSILGVEILNGVVYAWRNNAGGTAAAIYKSAVGGWTAVALGRELAYTSGGTYQIAVGDTITGATSAATAVVTGISLRSGTVAAGTAAGIIVFASQTGTFQAENLDVGANLNVATIAGNSSAITLSPSGRIRTVVHNFGGQTGTKKIYGADGVNRGFEFNGTVYMPIPTGMTTDTPTHVGVNKNHLFFSFGASAQHSGTGTPHAWTLLSGANELALGDTITGFQAAAGSETAAAFGMYSRNQIGLLYGTSSSDWNLITYKDEAGAIENSIQRFGDTIYLDDRGLTTLTASQAYGNFEDATISRLIKPFLNTRKILVNASCVVKDKNQYRLFFSDDSALFVTFENGRVVGMLPQLFADTVKCTASGEDADGAEWSFFGSDNGFVYEMEKGTSFDGDAIEYYLFMAFDHMGSPRIEKSFRKATFDVQGESYASFVFTYQLGWGSTEVASPGSQTITQDWDSAVWDELVWDAFTWDGSALTPSQADLDGDAENISLIVRGSSDEYQQFTLFGSMVDFIQRRLLR